ncbi:hypothetical protein CRENBAI_006652 [Crenichthys baileyi]|uniref:Uncharacterized protein n=1 Tax=Crenichthys baileyi TaxID=28760 RepID=A0AAV9RG79_9TELE
MYVTLWKVQFPLSTCLGKSYNKFHLSPSSVRAVEGVMRRILCFDSSGRFGRDSDSMSDAEKPCQGYNKAVLSDNRQSLPLVNTNLSITHETQIRFWLQPQEIKTS